MGRREDGAAGHRHARLQELVFEELVSLLGDEVADPALESVRVVCVVLSVDYRHARVHFALERAGTLDAVARALERATPFLRARLGATIELKRTPELRFVCDAVVQGEVGTDREGGA